jgi:hypothetical protein
MEREEIIGRIRIKMEEISQEGEAVIESPLIEELLDETADEIQLLVPRYLIETETLIYGDSETNQVSNADGSGYVVLPSDFLRLAYFKMTEWTRPVINPISEEHPDFVNQHNLYTRGKPAKPVCVIRWDDTEEAMIMEYYSIVTEHTIERAAYIPKRLAEELQDNLIDPYTWLVCAKVFQVYSTDEGAEKKARERVSDWIRLHQR